VSDRQLETLLALTERRAVPGQERAIARELRSDPALARSLDRQRRVLDALQAGGPAPPESLGIRLRDIACLPSARRRPSPLTTTRRSLSLVAAATVAAALAVISIAGWPGGGGTSLPSAMQVSAVWVLPDGRAAVAAAPETPAQLDVSYHGIVFPNFHDREGWHPVGVRRDRIGGVTTVTVFYATGDRRASYTVVPGTGLAVPSGASRLRVAGLSLREFRSGDRWIVTFEHAGATCVLTAAAPRERAWLVRLATWHGGPTTTPA